MENKKSLLIIFTLIISAHLLLFANLDLEEKVVVAQNKPAANISKINLKNIVIKKPEPKVEPVVVLRRIHLATQTHKHLAS